MEYHYMITINKNKRIGSVIFVVEGRKMEPRIIRNIFNKVLGYDIYQQTQDKQIIKIGNSNDIYSKVAIVVSDKPQISGVTSFNDYLQESYKRLVDNGLDVNDSAIYFIFDRDRENNSQEILEDAIQKLTNSRDNPGFEMNGLLLLSYPCVEALYLNVNNDDKKFGNGKSIKTYSGIKKYRKELTMPNIINASNKMLDIINQLNIDFSIDDLNDFSVKNQKILDEEEKTYKEDEVYISLSLLCIALIDLGILELDEKQVS